MKISITDFKKEFNNAIKSKPNANEVILFTEMAKLLNLLKHKSVFLPTNITHQHYVNYSSKYIKKIKKIEISDLLIISFVKNKPDSIKITFLQNKLNSSKGKNSSTKFIGNCFQYELLNLKPEIRPIRTNFPKNIISFTKYNSITAYGLFYFDGKDINMSYSIASTLKAIPKFPILINTNFKFQINNLGNFITINANKELMATDQINCFVDSLINGQIGAPISDNFDVKKFIYSLLLQILNENQSSEIFAEINEITTEMKVLDDNLLQIAINLNELPNILVVTREN